MRAIIQITFAYYASVVCGTSPYHIPNSTEVRSRRAAEIDQCLPAGKHGILPRDSQARRKAYAMTVHTTYLVDAARHGLPTCEVWADAIGGSRIAAAQASQGRGINAQVLRSRRKRRKKEEGSFHDNVPPTCKWDRFTVNPNPNPGGRVRQGVRDVTQGGRTGPQRVDNGSDPT